MPLLLATAGMLDPNIAHAHAAKASEAANPHIPKTPFIALILPTKSKSLGPYANAIKKGVFASERVYGHADLPHIRLYETDDRDSDVLHQYLKASEAGAVGVIGPLSLSATNHLSQALSSLPIPILTLNRFDQYTSRKARLYSFSLSLENEGMQVATIMARDGIRSPVIISTDTALSRRMVQGFSEEWKKQKNKQPTLLIVDPLQQQDTSMMERMNTSDGIFVAMDGRAASSIRPFLGNDRPVYGTSQINLSRQKNVRTIDLAGVNYLEIPWLAQVEDDDFSDYNRTPSTSYDLERLYALGADAWRVEQAILAGKQVKNLYGLSGILTLGLDGIIRRDLLERVIIVPMALPKANSSAAATASIPTTPASTIQHHE